MNGNNQAGNPPDSNDHEGEQQHDNVKADGNDGPFAKVVALVQQDGVNFMSDYFCPKLIPYPYLEPNLDEA